MRTQVASASKLVRTLPNGYIDGSLVPNLGTSDNDVSVINGTLAIATSTLVSNSTTSQTIASFPLAVYRSGKLLIEAQDLVGGNFAKTELLYIQDGVAVNSTFYANVAIGTQPGVYDISISGSNVIVTVTPATTHATRFKVVAFLTKI